MRLPALLCAALLAAACPVLTPLRPCATDAECPRGGCGQDGFCTALDGGGAGDDGGRADDAGDEEDGGAGEDGGPVDDDAGVLPDDGGRSDAGNPPTDAGFDDAGQPVDEDAGFPDAGFPDAGFEDAGPVPRVLVRVQADSPTPVGYAVRFPVDTTTLGTAGPLVMFDPATGARVPFARDPEDAPAQPERFWVKLPVALASGASLQLAMEARPESPGPGPLESVFVAGDDWEGAPAATTTTSTAGAATATRGAGKLLLDTTRLEDAAIGRATTTLTRGSEWLARHRVRVPAVGPSGRADIAFVRMLAMVEGTTPAVAPDATTLFPNEILSIGMAENGGYLFVNTTGNVDDAFQDYFWLPGAGWSNTCGDCRFVGLDEGFFDVVVESGPNNFFVRILDENGNPYTETLAVNWSGLPQRGGVGAPLSFYFGDPFEGATEEHWGDVESEYFYVRLRVDDEPDVTVTGP